MLVDWSKTQFLVSLKTIVYSFVKPRVFQESFKEGAQIEFCSKKGKTKEKAWVQLILSNVTFFFKFFIGYLLLLITCDIKIVMLWLDGGIVVTEIIGILLCI